MSSSASEPVKLNNRHRDTLLEIFQHPTSHNIQWHAVVSLLEAVGSVEDRHDGKVRVQVGRSRGPLASARQGHRCAGRP